MYGGHYDTRPRLYLLPNYLVWYDISSMKQQEPDSMGRLWLILAEIPGFGDSPSAIPPLPADYVLQTLN